MPPTPTPLRRLAIKLAKTALAVGLPLLVGFLLIRPEPITASLVHGVLLCTLALMLLGALAAQSEIRWALRGGLLAAGSYVALTTLPLLAEVVVPALPTEWLLLRAGGQVAATSRPDQPDPGKPVILSPGHWTVATSGDWAEYSVVGPAGEPRSGALNPRRVAFHRIGHDLFALLLGLLGALLGSLYVEPDPNLKRPMPAPEAKQVVHRMLSRNR